MYVFSLLNVFVQEAFPNTISPTLLLATTSLTSGATGLKNRSVKKILRILMKDCFLILNLVQIAWHCLDNKDAPAYPDLMQVEINIINNVLLSFIIYFIINILYLIMVIIITKTILTSSPPRPSPRSCCRARWTSSTQCAHVLAYPCSTGSRKET